MTRSCLIPVLLLSSLAGLALAANAGADTAGADTAKVKQMQVRTAAEVKSVFRLASADGGKQAIEISCKPASSSWCAKDFVTACDNAKGGMSVDPDGGVTCSLPQYK